jgi:hypothetical protein
MQSNKGVSIIPMTARGRAPIHKRDGFVALVQDNIGEGHTHGAGPTYQVVNMQAHKFSIVLI